MTLDEKIQQQEKVLLAALAAMCQEMGSDNRAAILFAETLLDDVCSRIDTLDNPELDEQRRKEHFDVLIDWLRDSLPLIMMTLEYYSRMIAYSELKNEQMKIQAGGEPFQKGETMLEDLKENHSYWLETLLSFLQEHSEKIGVHIVSKAVAMPTTQGNSTVH